MEFLIDIDRLGLTKAQKRDFSFVLPYMQHGNWVTSVTIQKAMYANKALWKKDIIKASAILAKLYNKAGVLERRKRANIYFHNISKNTSTYAYRIKPDLITEAEINLDARILIEYWPSLLNNTTYTKEGPIQTTKFSSQLSLF